MIVTQAPQSQLLTLSNTNPAIFRDISGGPCMLPISGSSSFQLKPFGVCATGGVQPTQACDLTIILYGASKQPTPASVNPADWIALATSIAEPIGGAGDPPETMWLIQGLQMMYSLFGRKLQGAFNSNIADNPTLPIDMQNHLIDLQRDVDPVMIFAVGAKVSVASGALPCRLQMVSFYQSGM